MKAGLFKEQVEIIRSEIAKNEFGEETTEWKSLYNTRARLIHNSGSRNNSNDEIVYSYIKTIMVRYYVPVEEFDRVKMFSKIYRILEIEPSDDKSYKTIKIELVND